jgi:hypothetical protein
MTKKRFVSVLWFSVLCGFVLAQPPFAYQLDQSIPVEANGRVLAMPWAGGLNSAQYNTIDLNGDAQADLVLYDRTANKLLTYLFRGSSYEYAPEFERALPRGLSQWVLLRDFNCDGRKDIFTSDPFGIRIFVNSTRGNGPLTWRPYDGGNPLFTKGFSGNINLKVNETDIPAIDDIDGDGDLDVLNFRFVGLNTVEYHKNFSRERTGTCDSLQMERVTQNFGGFEDCTCGRIAFGQSCAQLGGGRTQHAGGKSLLTLDLDNDGDRELLFSEESCAQLYMLPNNGSAATAQFNSFTPFPTGTPVAIPFFPAAYFEDVDGDSRKDLLVTPTQYIRNFALLDFQRSNWFYKNTGTNTAPQFTFSGNQFLQSEMIDVGDYSTPALFDFDGDGDDDLFVGFFANTSFRGSIYLYENVGQGPPAFRLVTSDFANLSLVSLYNFKPMFSDLNGDGKIDLAFTATGAQSGQTALFFLPNEASNRLNVSASNLQTTSFRLGQSENLSLVDVDLNGLPDILLGRANGSLQLWRNTGSGGVPAFTAATDSFLGLGASTSRQTPTTAAADLDGDGNTDLIVGDQAGRISIFPDFRAGTAQPVTDWFTLGSEPVPDMNFGGRVWPTVANLFNDARPGLIVGNTLGGLFVLRPADQSELGQEPTITLYPNPVRQSETLFIKVDRNAQIQFFTVVGQPVNEPLAVVANQPLPLSPNRLAAGLYIVRITVRGTNYARRVVITQ